MRPARPTPPARLACRPRGLASLAPLAAVLALLAIASLAPLAAAHAVLASSTPAGGSRLDEAPLYVSVVLTEPADEGGSTLQVLDAAGTRVDLGDLDFTHGSQPMMRVSLPTDLPDGPYRIAWQALSGTDGHTTRGEVGFAVGDHLPPDTHSSDPEAISWLGATGRWLAFTGLALAFGSALFLLWMPGAVALPRHPSLEALLAGAALHLLGVTLLVKSTLDQTGISLSALAGSTVGGTLLTRAGLGASALVFAALAQAKRAPPRGPPLAAIVLLASAGLGSARLGHAAIAGLPGVAVDAIHLLASATWIGGLLVFLWTLADARRLGWEADQVRVLGVRFGTAALVCVVALVAAGAAATLAILGPPDWAHPFAAFASPWGKLLVAKVALTGVLVAIAAVNRYGILEPAAPRGFSHGMERLVMRVAPDLRNLDSGAPGLRRLLQVEAVLGVVTLALAALLTSISPPAEAQAATLEVPGSSAEFHGSLTIDPTPSVGGTSSLRLHIETHSGQAVEDTCGRTAPQSCVNAVVGENGTGQTYALTSLGGGDWQADGVLWTRSGTWDVVVRIQTAEVFEDTMTFTFTLAQPRGP